MLKVGDKVFVSNPDLEYEAEYGVRKHHQFFGRVTEIDNATPKPIIGVEFEKGTEKFYYAEELSLASELKNMTLENFEDKFNVCVNATYV